MEQNIVIAVDDSLQAEQAVRFYLERVHRHGNRVVMVHCVELVPELTQPKAAHMSRGALADMWTEEEARMKSLEQKMKLLLTDKQVAGVLRCAAGKPGEVICHIADQVAAVMIITGTRGMSKMRRTILGSVSDYIANHAVCPVMVCRDVLTKSERRRCHSSGSSDVQLASMNHEHLSFSASVRHMLTSSAGRTAPQHSKDDSYA